jgi:hypothetical protein
LESKDARQFGFQKLAQRAMIDNGVLPAAGRQWWLWDAPEWVNDSTIIHGRLFDSNENLQWCLKANTTKTNLPKQKSTFRLL